MSRHLSGLPDFGKPPARHRRAAAWLSVAALMAVAGLVSRGTDVKLRTVGGVTKLPPFLVETYRGPTWRYARLPGAEVLARCDDETTTRLALAFYRAEGLLDAILPDRFQRRLDVPGTYIFYDEALWPATKKAMSAEIRLANPALRIVENEPAAPEADSRDASPFIPPPAIQFPRREPAASPGAGIFTNLQLTDPDSVMTFAMVSRSYVDPRRTYLRPAYVAELLKGRVPSLPDWFQTGFLGLYQQINYGDERVTLPVPAFAGLAATPSVGPDVAAANGLLPLARLFRGTSGMSPDDLAKWVPETALFVAWGIDPAGGRAAAFWRFVDGSARGLPIEREFRACFGFGLAEAVRQLAAYGGESHVLRWRLARRFRQLPDFSLRDATWEDVARIEGEWERLEARYVKSVLPYVESSYFLRARRTLQHAYDRGDRDPRLLASLGLLECDAGDNRAAVRYLAPAAQRGVIGPQVYFELAQYRYDYELDRSRRDDGKLEPAQGQEIQQWLITACGQAPPHRQIFGLMAEVAAHTAGPTAPAVFDTLGEGIRLFPDDMKLFARVVRLCAADDRRPQAEKLIRWRRKLATDDGVRQELASLDAGLKWRDH